LLATLLTIVALVAFPTAIAAQEFPRPAGYLNDFAGVFEEDVRLALEDALRLTEEETSAEVVVATVPDLGGLSIEEYAVKLFEQWRIGQRGSDNGVLLIVAIAEREVRIEVGYGLEPYLTDGLAGRILDNEVMPDLRNGAYSLGLTKGARAIRVALDETGYTTGAAAPIPDDGQLPGIADRIWIVLAVGALSLYVVGYMARTRSIWLGGAWGAAVGAFISWLIPTWGGVIIGAVLGGLAGLALDSMLSIAYRHQVKTGGATRWTKTWGGFKGVGPGMRSGSFRGFGGGRSGGGGASRGF
jgi:uncharacterized protein